MGDVQLFIDLGLGVTEAKVYSTLLELGTAKASAISKVSMVARPDVYRALSNLQEVGLIEKIVAHPLLFRSIPVENGISIMLEQKAKKYSRLEAQSAALISKIKNKKNNISVPESQLVLIPSKQALIKNLHKSIENSHKRIDVFTSCKRLKFACHCLSEQLENAWQRGVKGRAILEENCELMFDFQRTCWRKPSAQIKYIDSFPKTVMAIYDSKEVYIFLDNKADLTESSALWTANSGLVSLAQYGFNSCWKQAKER